MIPKLVDDAFTKEAFLADLHDWESAVKPAWTSSPLVRTTMALIPRPRPLSEMRRRRRRRKRSSTKD